MAFAQPRSTTARKPKRFAAGGQTAALSFIPAPTAASISAASAGTPTPPVSYTSSVPATAPNFGPVVAQIDRFGTPQTTPSATLPDSSGKQITMYDPGATQNPITSALSPPTATTPPPSSAAVTPASNAPSQVFGLLNGTYLPVTQQNTGINAGSYFFNPNTGAGAAPNNTLFTQNSSGGYTPFTPGAKRGGAIKKQKLAGGGIPTSEAMDPWYTRSEERSMVHPEGLIRSMGGGRTDIHPIDVPAGSYVVPADVVSGLAEGNTMAGSGIIDRMMHSGPFGIQMGGGHHGSGPPRAPSAPIYKEPTDPYNTVPQDSRGGAAKDHGHTLVPIIVAGGEHIIYPQTIQQKFGDLSKGHKVLDKWVLKSRAQNVDDIKKLKGPKK